MAMTEEDRSFFARRLFLAWLGVSVLAVLVTLAGTYALLHEVMKGLGPIQQVLGSRSGDTPVVLVGGSLSFKAGSQKGTSQWTPIPNCASPCTEYFIDPGYSVSTIVLRDSSVDNGADAPDPGDNNPSKDKIRVDISNASTWEIDEYAIVNSVETPVASIKPNGATELHVKLLAASPVILCPNGSSKRIMLGTKGVCPASGPVTDPVTFTKITLQIDNGAGVNTASGSLSCVDDSASPTQGHCRIVFRGSPN